LLRRSAGAGTGAARIPIADLPGGQRACCFFNFHDNPFNLPILKIPLLLTISEKVRKTLALFNIFCESAARLSKSVVKLTNKRLFCPLFEPNMMNVVC
jgi:hypothetical protein